ncbi:hypothetical protein F0562_034116 [Nyssa sinensis]|uniref:Uncharacterized protein n=1 Tax=Nyssa sinensis TaxID=561372 RepID=A0A5J5AHS8_9ASTE|nr:hypothetical protein F0562_034116 [Nyssa sinensis]
MEGCDDGAVANGVGISVGSIDFRSRNATDRILASGAAAGVRYWFPKGTNFFSTVHTTELAQAAKKYEDGQVFGLFKHRVGPVDADATKDMEADATKAGGAVPDEDYLVNQMPPQYHRDPNPHHPFYSDLGTSLFSAPSTVTRGDLDEYFQRLRIDFFILVPQELSTQCSHI